MTARLLDLRNLVDFTLRGILRWRLPGTVEGTAADRELAAEVGELLAAFDWAGALAGRSREVRIADVGARNFFLAVALDARFRALGFDPEIHGIEIDAFRRYRNGRMRSEYGAHYAGRIARGEFHAVDFLRWSRPLDVALVLNPFVDAGPLRAWGLPISRLRPVELFRHARGLLDERRGVLLVSCPTRAELAIVRRLAYRAGFALRERRDWLPRPGSRQRQPRFAALFAGI